MAEATIHAQTSEPKIPIPMDKIAEFCRRWKIAEFALFGSVLRDDFRPDSDVDVLVTFEPEARWTLFDWVDIREELCALLGREVDLVSRRGIETSRNYLRRNEILSTAQVMYAAR
ncbi:MAG: nucleotidyltransferase family protein [Anaerolineae bacterium]|nr:nucleotidyltransferase family protein [Candidatus Roseilinea sp.]MDW8450952.1 nucleotidyltransferase family protein [Anaerolineae bacterium]